MDANTTALIPHPTGEPSLVEELSSTADTFGVHVEWDPAAPVTPLGQLPVFHRLPVTLPPETPRLEARIRQEETDDAQGTV
jgi:hypothetical protein